ncbi:UPF0488 protein CG14286 [Dermacentor albipictus]|uniref:UPF0488 protein CG14286 n=1 Tax=Dermacentor albipictus TaxID=60249 RepID=UPI0038FCDA95
MQRRKQLPVQKLPTPQASTSSSLEDPSNDEDPNEKFERELKWCIEQLNISLSHPDTKKKNYTEQLRALQTLQNVKAPVVKKRQVMSMTLGNYREKMELEKAKFITDSTRKTKLQPQHSAETKSIFLRKVLTSNRDSQPGVPECGTEFKFNFAIDTEDT